MLMIIDRDTTISTSVVADEVKVVRDATLTVTGTLTCKLLSVESSAVVVNGSGVVYVVEEVHIPGLPPTPSGLVYIGLLLKMLYDMIMDFLKSDEK